MRVRLEPWGLEPESLIAAEAGEARLARKTGLELLVPCEFPLCETGKNRPSF